MPSRVVPAMASACVSWPQVQDAFVEVPSAADGQLVRVDELEVTDRALLHERHIVSKELAGLDASHQPRSGAAVQVGHGYAIMVNEEDHLRIQAVRSGLDLERSFSIAHQLAEEVGQKVPFAYHKEFGFLTACPTNVGTGLRASVLIHLPALVLTKEIGRVLAGLQQVGLTYRGLYGEGSEVIGNFFQISNQTTLGRSEKELLDYLDNVVRHVIRQRDRSTTRLGARRGLYYRRQTVACLWHVTICTKPFVRRGDEFSEWCAIGSGIATYFRCECIHTQQASHLQSIWQHLSHREGRLLTEEEASVVRAAFVRETFDRSTQ